MKFSGIEAKTGSIQKISVWSQNLLVAMNIETTGIRDKGVNLYHSDLRKMLVLVDYPDFLKKYETLYVMFVCLRDETHSHDAYIHEDKPYISIALEYSDVAGVPFEQLTVICKNQLISYLNSLNALSDRDSL